MQKGYSRYMQTVEVQARLRSLACTLTVHQRNIQAKKKLAVSVQ